MTDRVKLAWWRLIFALASSAWAETLHWRDHAKFKIREIEGRMK